MFRPLSKFLIIAALSLLSSLTLAESVWVDVRSPEEYGQDHIDGDANIPLATIETDKMLSMFEKDDEINLYCRSGRRAEQAKAILETAGYTHVINRGGIDEVRLLRSETGRSEAVAQ